MGTIIKVATLYLPCQFYPDKADVTAVLAEGAVNDWAVYIGIGTPEWVQKRGTKIDPNQASLFFGFDLPELMKQLGKTYRY